MRKSGILMPVFSLNSPYGIGTFGKQAYTFIDFLEKAGQSYWQILPLNPTNYGDSPYQSFSSYAGNPYFIDLDMLEKDGLLTEEEILAADFGEDNYSIDYGKLYTNRMPLLRKAFDRFQINSDFNKFCSQNSWWLDDFSLFMALKDAHGGKSFIKWEKSLVLRNTDALQRAKEQYKDDILFYCFIQYLFDSQWQKLKAYANKKGIEIIGDIPIYVAADSADVWADGNMFMLDENCVPTLVAGCPPDAFSKDGQLWGNPLYRWDVMEKDGFGWWKKRLGYALKLYDVVRIDHFRGFESFYAIKNGEKTAKNGKWIKGPDIKFFNALKEEFGENLPIIAEDLGFLSDEVLKMLENTGFPGMKVMQFAFSGEENDYLPHNYNKNCVVYTGTHDNDTIMGWTKNNKKESLIAEKYLHTKINDGFNWAMIRAAMMSVADTAIFMMCDFMGLGSEARINTPSTLGENWKWRIDGGCINDWLANIIFEITDTYSRAPKKTEEV